MGKLIKNGYIVVFQSNKGVIANKLGDLVTEAELIDDVCKVNLQTQTTIVNRETGNRRFVHINSNDVKK